MPLIGVIGAYRVLPATIAYVPKAGYPARQMEVVRSTKALGNSKIKPIILRDPDFWPLATFEEIVTAISKAGYRAWTSDSGAWKPTSGAGITKPTWDSLRVNRWEETEMVGCMSAQITQGAFQDYFVTAAPNLIYSPSKGYVSHTLANSGTQMHSEAIMAAQLDAFATTICTLHQTPIGGVQQIAAPKRDDLVLSADLFIEKGSTCPACTGDCDTKIGVLKWRV